MNNSEQIERDYRELKSLSKAEVIARFPSRLDKGHLKSESKADLISAILNARYSRKALEAWGK